MPSSGAYETLLHVMRLLPFYNIKVINSTDFASHFQSPVETWLRAFHYTVIMEQEIGINYHSFLLRLWRVKRNGEHKKRVSLENVENGEKRGFICLEDLSAYLAELTKEWDETSAEGNGPEVQE